MRKATVIATCLVNSGMINRVEDAENAVRHVFDDEFPARHFAEWNQPINKRVAEEIIATVGRASSIDVKKFIEDLW